MNQKGFTLLEILLVMGILALLGAIIVPSLSLPARPPKPPLVVYLTQLQANAVKNSQTVHVFVDNHQLKAEPEGGAFDLGADNALDIVRPPKTGFLNKQLLAVFYADGTAVASDFGVVLKKPGYNPQLLYNIKISPFSAEVIYTYP